MYYLSNSLTFHTSFCRFITFLLQKFYKFL
nr:MAG TPA: hypothetical protein [Caudoviricetes sp.]